MLYSIDENRDSYYDLLDYLDEQVYLTEEESKISPYQIPIISLNEQNLVHFDYITQFSSDESSIESILDTLKETHNLDNLSIALPEYELLVNPLLVESNINFALLPISEDSIAYQFCEACIDAFAESGDEGWLDYLLEDNAATLHNILHQRGERNATNAQAAAEYSAVRNRIAKEIQDDKTRRQNAPWMFNSDGTPKSNTPVKDKPMPEQPSPPAQTSFQKGLNFIKNAPKNIKTSYKNLGQDISQGWKNKGISGVGSALLKNKKTVAGTAAVVGGAGLALKKFVDYRKRIAWEAKNKPRTWLAKKIASLRSIYQKYLARARAARDKGQASIFQKVAATILGIIDALMRRLQNAVNSFQR